MGSALCELIESFIARNLLARKSIVTVFLGICWSQIYKKIGQLLVQGTPYFVWELEFWCRIKAQSTARRRRPVGPSASPVLNNVECWATKKIIIIFFGLAADAANPKEKAPTTDSHIDKLLTKMHPAARKLCFQVLFERLRLFCQNSQDTH